MKKIILKPGEISLSTLRAVSRGHMPISLPAPAYKKMAASKKVVDDIINDGRVVYGINTGFGVLAKVRITEDKFETLQRNIVLSHATGVGKFLKDDVVRLVLLLKINALSQGYS